MHTFSDLISACVFVFQIMDPGRDKELTDGIGVVVPAARPRPFSAVMVSGHGVGGVHLRKNFQGLFVVLAVGEAPGHIIAGHQDDVGLLIGYGLERFRQILVRHEFAPMQIRDVHDAQVLVLRGVMRVGGEDGNRPDLQPDGLHQVGIEYEINAEERPRITS